MLGIWAAGGAVTLVWGNSAQFSTWRFSLAVFAVIAAAFSGWSAWTRGPSGRLVWDGSLWHWECRDHSSPLYEPTVSVVVDLQFAAVLCLTQASASPIWLWVERAQMPERWLDLRRAVHAPVRPIGVVTDASTAQLVQS